MSDLVRTVETMGTVVSIRVRPVDGAESQVLAALGRARRRLERADAVFSTWKPDSPVSRLRRGESDWHQASDEIAEVAERCHLARRLTGGWFDPWAAPGGFDPTGLVKGWATQRAMVELVDSGAAGAIVNAGGDAALHGRRADGSPWRMGIQNPFDAGSLAAVAEPTVAIATSGCYERGPHIYNPFSGVAASAVASASVTGPELDLADAMATALVAGGSAALEHVGHATGYEALIIDHCGRLVRTPGFPEAAVAFQVL